MTNIIEATNKLLWYELPLEDKEDLIKFLDETNTRDFDKEKFEKDFYLTIILHRISTEIPEINFKGWTCLNKIYFPYFRLSEDLDFSLSTEYNFVNTNWKREKFAKHFRNKIKELTKTIWRELNDDEFHHKKAQWHENLKKKEYTYLKYIITYPSIYGKKDETIKVELTYTDKQHLEPIHKPIQSLFIDPLTKENIFSDKTTQCLNIQEMVAEKCRACLTRRYPAIRDFFDLRYLQSQWIDILANKEIIRAKCDEVSDRKRTLHDKYDELEKQIQTHLIPVANDLYEFNLREIYDKMIELQKELFE